VVIWSIVGPVIASVEMPDLLDGSSTKLA